MGIEPTSKAWEALVLPLNYARRCVITGLVYNQGERFAKSPSQTAPPKQSTELA